MLDYRDGRVMQAATALHFACELDRKQQYKEHFRVIRKEAFGPSRRQSLSLLRRMQRSFSNYGRAIEQYRKAVSYECEDAAPYARLAYLVSRLIQIQERSFICYKSPCKKILTTLNITAYSARPTLDKECRSMRSVSSKRP